MGPRRTVGHEHLCRVPRLRPPLRLRLVADESRQVKQLPATSGQLNRVLKNRATIGFEGAQLQPRP